MFETFRLSESLCVNSRERDKYFVSYFGYRTANFKLPQRLLNYARLAHLSSLRHGLQERFV